MSSSKEKTSTQAKSQVDKKKSEKKTADKKSTAKKTVEKKTVKKTEKAVEQVVEKSKKTKKTKEQKPDVEDTEVEQTDVETKTEQKSEYESKFLRELETTKSELKRVKEVVQTLSKCVKLMESAHNADVKKMSKTRRRHPNKPPTGFATEKELPADFAEWLGEEEGTKLSGPQITKRVWSKLKELGLQAEDRRVFRTNREVSRILGVPSSVNDHVNGPDAYKDPEGFNFRTIQKRISYAMNPESHVEEKKEEKKSKKSKK